MKKHLVNNTDKLNRKNNFSTWKLFPALLLIIMFSGLLARSQTLPQVSLRFANPRYDCPTQTYCLDVEVKSDTPDQRLFGINVRFFYDDGILEFLGTSDHREGYGMPSPPEIITGEGGVFFGFAGNPEWFNGTVQLMDNAYIVYLPVGNWQKAFSICFQVDDPNSLDIQNFCPSIVWDLQQNPPEFGGGFLPGDDGVVITLVDPSGEQDSAPTTEEVVQFNWEYNAGEGYFGNHVDLVCIPTSCWEVPVSNWALFLGIGLMVVATAFIYRKRIG
jgi:hypothetical protein